MAVPDPKQEASPEPHQFAAGRGPLERPLAFTNDVFDILHHGHVTFLAEARALDSRWRFALISDPSARRLGKDGRPARSTRLPTARMAVVGPPWRDDSLVTWFEEDTPLAPILDAARAPREGRRWTVDAVVGAPRSKGCDGTVHSIAFRHDRSTAQLLGKFRR